MLTAPQTHASNTHTADRSAPDTHADDIDPEEEEVAAFLLAFVADNLAPIFTDDPDRLPAARKAALRVVGGHRPTDEADLLLATEMVAFGIAAVRTVGIGLRPGLPSPESRRLLACATALNRTEVRLRRMRLTRKPVPVTRRADPAPTSASTPAPATARGSAHGSVRGPAPVPTRGPAQAVAPVPTPAPVRAAAPIPASKPARAAAPVAEAAPRHVPLEAPSVAPLDTPLDTPLDAPSDAPTERPATASPTAADWRERDAWADAAAQAAQALLTAAPSLPPDKRKEALDRARTLGNASRDVRAGLPIPKDLRLPG